MTVRELMETVSASNLVEGANVEAEITCGYCCDLLSWVLARGKQGMAWMTVQNHANVIAVAVLMDMACVILTEDVMLEEASLQKAQEEGLAVLAVPMTAFELSGIMAKAGVLPPCE